MDKLIDTFTDIDNDIFEHYQDEEGKEYLLTYDKKYKMKIKLTFTGDRNGYINFKNEILEMLQS